VTTELRRTIVGPWSLDRVGMRDTAGAGQRLRASPVWIGADRPAEVNGDIVAAATAVELLHIATLCTTTSSTRARSAGGQVATWALHGAGSAIVAGDALVAASFALIPELSGTVVRELATSLAS
jgi:geranylgeranyl diphosphate synthase, type I